MSRRRTFGNGATSPLLQLATASDVAMQHTPRWVSNPDLRLPLTLLSQISPYTSESTTRPSRTDETIHLSIGLCPDLRACSPVMCVGIRGVVELVCPDSVGNALSVLASLVIVV